MFVQGKSGRKQNVPKKPEIKPTKANIPKPTVRPIVTKEVVDEIVEVLEEAEEEAEDDDEWEDDDEDDDDDDDDIPVGKNKTSLPESKKSQEQSVTQKKAMNK